MEDIAITERRFVDIKAAEYRSRGYEVEREVPLDFAPGFCADLLIRKGDEVKVIEVKTRTALTLDRDYSYSELSDALHAMPGWSFELLLVGEPERLSAPESAQSLNAESIPQRIDDAEKALAAGFPHAALLLAWSACEATVRILVEADGIAIKRVTRPAYVINMAVTHGVISMADFDYLDEIMGYRNAIAHGFEVDDFDPRFVPELIAATQRLMSEFPVDNATAFQ